MFSVDNEISNHNISNYAKYKNKNNNEEKSFKRNIDVSSIYSDKFTNVDKIIKSFSGNNRLLKKIKKF